MTLKTTIAMLAALLVSGSATVSLARTIVVDRGLVIEDVTLISPERRGPLRLADVVIVDGRIARIGTNLRAGANAQRIDGRGRYLVPGLIDSHVHLAGLSGLDEGAEARPALAAAFRDQLPRAYLAFGFTTIADLDLRARDRTWFMAASLRPRLIDCQRALRIAGGYGAIRIPADTTTTTHPYLLYEPGRAESWPAALAPAQHAPGETVERAIAQGASCIKVFVEPGFGGAFNWPVPRAGTLRAIRSATRRRGVPLFIHATGTEAWQAAVAADADVIAHGLWHWPGSRRDPLPGSAARAAINAAARSGVAVQPTLQVILGEQSLFDPAILDDRRLAFALPRSALAYLRSAEAEAARRALARTYQEAAGSDNAEALIGVAGERASSTLRLMDRAGVRLLLGTDTGGGEGIGNPPGLNGRLELQRWAESGVALARILRASTLDNARALGLADELGSIEVGKRADLLLLSADPLSDVAAYDAIETIFLNGDPIVRETLLPRE